MQLRDYQVACMQRINERIAAGVRRMILQLATGGGKTILAVALMLLALEQGQRVLFVAHRIELIDQAVDKLVTWGVPLDSIGVIRAGDPRVKPNAPFQVASVQSLRALPAASIVFIDEAHRSAAKSYKKIFDGYPAAVFFGLTASPERLDGQPLDMYEEIIVVAQPEELALAGYISSPIIYGVPDDLLPDVEDIKRINGDFNKKQLAIAVKSRKLVGSIQEHWIERAEGRRTVGFFVDIEHSKRECAGFLERNIPAEHIDGNMTDRRRREIVGRLRRREILIVTQVDLWIEGIDVAEIKCAILARPTQSLTVFLQSIGRIVRPFEDEIPLVLDHAGNTLIHGMPFEPRQYSLTGRVKRLAGNLIAKQCKNCFRAMAADVAVCPDCGVLSEEQKASLGTPRVVRTEDGTLVELPQDQSTIRQLFWKRTIKEASRMGFKLGWCRHEFKERFGEWPPMAWCTPGAIPVRTVDDGIKRKELRKLQAIAYKQKRTQEWVEERYYNMFQDTPRALLERQVISQAGNTTAETEEIITSEI